MPAILKVPSLGESITQATVGQWLKKEGDAVAADEPVVEVESEKATVAVPAPAAGVLRKILKQPGDTVAVGEAVGEIEEGAAAAKAPPAPAPKANGAPAAAAASGSASATASPSASASPAPAPSSAPAPHPRATPSARRMMAEHGVAAEPGPTGTVRKEDVIRALAPAPAAPAGARASVAVGARERSVPMSPLRRTVARRLLEAQSTAAILTTFNEIDMSRAMALREKHGPAFLEKHGVKLGFMSFFVKAAIEGLRAFPSVNAEVRGDAVVYKDHYDIGVAVGGGKGLVVPVVRDADAMSFAEIEKTIGALGKKARDNKIEMADLAGGTFTISNGGIYGSLLSTPILNPPQSGILGLHKIEKRAVVGDGDQVVVRPMMYVALSYDHRIIDGREAVGFLVKVKEVVEDPERILLEL
ncbi:MAG: 2-oxoglutarate dehydrogenase complex dihydrolipoyllysine-residue succinyltransferase [Anaeromyxobacter sp.]